MRGRDVVGQHARHVLDQAAAGDVRQRLAPGRRAPAARHAASRRCGSASAAPRPSVTVARERRRRVQPSAARVDDPADERKAVGMHAGGGEAEDDVAGRARRVAGDQRAALDRADREAGEIVVALGVHAGHLRGLAADQRAAGFAAAVGDAGDDWRAGRDVELAGREVVEEEERLGALHDQVVDAHRDEVDADRVVLAGVDRDLELGADAVGGGDQDRVAIARPP